MWCCYHDEPYSTILKYFLKAEDTSIAIDMTQAVEGVFPETTVRSDGTKYPGDRMSYRRNDWKRKSYFPDGMHIVYDCTWRTIYINGRDNRTTWSSMPYCRHPITSPWLHAEPGSLLQLHHTVRSRASANAWPLYVVGLSRGHYGLSE